MVIWRENGWIHWGHNVKVCKKLGHGLNLFESIFLKFLKPPTLGHSLAVPGEVDCGMVHGHAYSVLHAVEVEGVRLIACRNPWGSDSEWNGPWSDRSEEWKANPSIAMLGEIHGRNGK